MHLVSTYLRPIYLSIDVATPSLLSQSAYTS
jgi:hypothetical protein